MLPQLDETIRSEMERSKMTGLAIALLEHGELAEAAAYGTASVETSEPLSVETLCGIMSVTKPIVGTAILQLRDAGKFELDDPINRYLAPVSITNEWESETPVTIRQLLTHTGGLPVGTGADPPGRHPLAEYVDLTAKTAWRPGSQMVYANWGYAALGLLIERFSGQSVGDYLRENIFAPLGLKDTVYGPPSGERATGHFVSRLDRSIRTLPMDEWPVIPTSPAGGCWSTVGDLTKFITAHLESGGRILKPETAREMHEVHAALGAPDGGMGLGFRVTRSNGRKLVCHGGDGGGFTAFAGFYPDEGVGVVLLMNTGGMQTARSLIANTALALLTPGISVGHGPEPTLPKGGVYRSTFWDIELEARDNMLTPTTGLVLSEEPVPSALQETGGYGFDAIDGMFHGFELVVHHHLVEGHWRSVIYGGVYPFTFVWDRELEEPPPIDETNDLTGEWRGTVHTPMAPLAITLRIEGPTTATLSTPLGLASLENVRAERGRAEMEFPLSLPGIGDFLNFVRLESRAGRLTGKTYARGKFGETIMRTELERS